MPVPFGTLEFGYADARHESASDPRLLTEGFLDHAGAVDQLLSTPKFLLLGRKGSGKSAIAEHLRLAKRYDRFVTVVTLSEFPYEQFGGVVAGSGAAKYPTTWRWLLLLYLFAKFTEDEGVLTTANNDFYKAVGLLEELQLLPLPSLEQVVTRTSRKAFKMGLPKVLEASFGSTAAAGGLEVLFLADKLEAIAETFSSPSQHLLIVDGLDDALTRQQVPYAQLSGLISAADRLNHGFGLAGTRAKVIVLCRTDLYERLPGPDTNKIRRDSSVTLNWYSNPKVPSNSCLVELANLRARLSDPSITDVFSIYFPPSASGFRYAYLKYLLDNTRYTPRDFIQILKSIQEFAEPGVLSKDQIFNGIRSYSTEYFLPEIRNELQGYVDAADIQRFLDVLCAAPSRQFTMAQLAEALAARPHLAGVELPRVLGVLFDCGAIGNLHRQPDGTKRVDYKFRAPHRTVNLDWDLIIHNGLLRALNLVH